MDRLAHTAGMTTLLPPDHPDRITLADEVHARPPEPLETPSRATYVAVLVAHEDRKRELAHLQGLCDAHGVTGPAEGATHFSTAWARCA